MRRRAFLGLVLAGPGAALAPLVAPAWASRRAVPARVTQLPLMPQSGSLGHALRRAGADQDLVTATTPTRPFSLIGLTWLPDPDVRAVAYVRTRTGGRWSAWTELRQQGDHRPQGPESRWDGVRDGTAPLWVGACDGFQISMRTAGGPLPRDARVELVDPAVSPDAGRVHRAAARVKERRQAVVTRADWGADESLRRGGPTYTGPVKVGFVHHTATSNDYGPEQAAEMVRGIYAYHVKGNGWSDIGYNLLVDRYGRVYEGRAGGVDLPVLGAHTGGFNEESFGVALLGDFSTMAPTERSLEALAGVLARKLRDAYRDPRARAVLTSAGGGVSRFPVGSKAVFDVVSGHRDAGSTSCPGSVLYGRLGRLRASVAADLGAGFVDPRVTGGPELAAGSRGPVHVRAGTLAGTAWTAQVIGRSGRVLRRVSGVGGSVGLSWDLTDARGLPVPPGRYVIRLSGAAGADPALPFESHVTVVDASSCRGTPLQRALCRPRDRSRA